MFKLYDPKHMSGHEDVKMFPIVANVADGAALRVGRLGSDAVGEAFCTIGGTTLRCGLLLHAPAHCVSSLPRGGPSLPDLVATVPLPPVERFAHSPQEACAAL